MLPNGNYRRKFNMSWKDVTPRAVGKVDYAVHILLPRFELPDKIADRTQRPSGSKDIVVYQDHVILIDSIGMDLHGIISIFLGIGLRELSLSPCPYTSHKSCQKSPSSSRDS